MGTTTKKENRKSNNVNLSNNVRYLSIRNKLKKKNGMILGFDFEVKIEDYISEKDLCVE